MSCTQWCYAFIHGAAQRFAHTIMMTNTWARLCTVKLEQLWRRGTRSFQFHHDHVGQLWWTWSVTDANVRCNAWLQLGGVEEKSSLFSLFFSVGGFRVSYPGFGNPFSGPLSPAMPSDPGHLQLTFRVGYRLCLSFPVLWTPSVFVEVVRAILDPPCRQTRL